MRVCLVLGVCLVLMLSASAHAADDVNADAIVGEWFSDDGKNKWSNGIIYDPNNGKTYSCKAKLEGDKLNVRGFIGISLFGRTTVWTRKRLGPVDPAARESVQQEFTKSMDLVD